MRARSLGVLLVLLVLPLAGCVKDDAPPVDDAVEGGPREGADPAGAASADTVAPPDLGHMPHLHDYWAGRERVVLFEGTLEPDTMDALALTFYNAFQRHEVRAGGVAFSLPDGQIVYEGTGVLEITASWSDPRNSGMAVSYRAGQGGSFSEPQSLRNGETLHVAVTPEMCDMPHMSVSRWAFFLSAEGTPATLLAPFDLRVEAVKIRDVMAFPGHPDLFEGKSEKVLLDEERVSEQVSYAKRTPNLATQGAFGEDEFAPARLVPMETQALRVVLRVLEAEAVGGEVADIRFFYQSADNTTLQPAQKLSGDMGSKAFVFQVAVAMGNVDSPYAPESQWRFMAEAATRFTGQEAEATCGGCTDTRIRFHVTVTAYDHVPPEE